jgi:hypothetical protein
MSSRLSTGGGAPGILVGNRNRTQSNVAAAPPISQNVNVDEKGMMVCVRVRPLSQKETEAGIRNCCQVINNSIVAIRKEGSGGYLKSEQPMVNDYAFDVAFDETSTQYEIYQQTAKRYIPNLLAGLNVTVFCYGATGAGKTHTMLGSTRSDEAAANAEAGIIPNAVCDLFQQIDESRRFQAQHGANGNEWTVVLSFIEVYNEQVYDLLETSGKVLSLREDSERGVVMVAGVIEQRVESYENVLELLQQGNKNRKTEATMANAVSSRSHAVLQLTIKHCRRLDCGRESVTESKLSMIDLAGSERASATNNRGARLQEGANINKSLLALANCINALSSNSLSTNQKQGNVKYRDSKLTHLLKSSLEGNCNLVMIANINPSHLTYEDSHNSLKYANRAKNIKVNPLLKDTVKESSWMEREARLKEENEMLRQRVAELERIISGMHGGIAHGMPQQQRQSRKGDIFSAGFNSANNHTPADSATVSTTKLRFTKPSRRDTLLIDKENINENLRDHSPTRSRQRDNSPVRRVYTSTDSDDDKEIEQSTEKSLDIVPPQDAMRKKINNFFPATEISKHRRDHTDDDNEEDGPNNHESHSSTQPTNPSQGQQASTSRNVTTQKSANTSSTSNKTGRKRTINIAEELADDTGGVDGITCPTSRSARKSVKFSNGCGVDDCNVSLATVDCMFDILSDSKLEEGLFANGESPPTPIKDAFQNDVASGSKPSAPQVGVSLRGISSLARQNDTAPAIPIKKRRTSFIPTMAGRRSVYLPDEMEPYQDLELSDTASALVAKPASVRSTRSSTALKRKSVMNLEDCENASPSHLGEENAVSNKENLISADPQNEAEVDAGLVKKIPTATLLGRRKSLASISSMLNVLASTDFGITQACKPVQLQNEADNNNFYVNDTENRLSLRSSARRKSILDGGVDVALMKQ